MWIVSTEPSQHTFVNYNICKCWIFQKTFWWDNFPCVRKQKILSEIWNPLQSPRSLNCQFWYCTETTYLAIFLNSCNTAHSWLFLILPTTPLLESCQHGFQTSCKICHISCCGIICSLVLFHFSSQNLEISNSWTLQIIEYQELYHIPYKTKSDRVWQARDDRSILHGYCRKKAHLHPLVVAHLHRWAPGRWGARRSGAGAACPLPPRPRWPSPAKPQASKRPARNKTGMAGKELAPLVTL